MANNYSRDRRGSSRGAAVALLRPAAVAVHLDVPHASPRNVIGVTIAEMDIYGTTVRVRGADQPDGSTGLAADTNAAAATDPDLAPGQDGAVKIILTPRRVTVRWNG